MKNQNIQLVKSESNDESYNTLEFLSELAHKLLAKVEFLQNVEYELKLKSLMDEDGLIACKKNIDFYDELQRFETYLIKLALKQTEGCQSCAARLLNLKTSTLNNKLKQHGIHLMTVVSPCGYSSMRHQHLG